MTEEDIDGTGQGGKAINKVLNKIAEAAGLGSSESNDKDAAGDDPASADPDGAAGASEGSEQGTI